MKYYKDSKAWYSINEDWDSWLQSFQRIIHSQGFNCYSPSTYVLYLYSQNFFMIFTNFVDIRENKIANFPQLYCLVEQYLVNFLQKLDNTFFATVLIHSVITIRIVMVRTQVLPRMYIYRD